MEKEKYIHSKYFVTAGVFAIVFGVLCSLLYFYIVTVAIGLLCFIGAYKSFVMSTYSPEELVKHDKQFNFWCVYLFTYGFAIAGILMLIGYNNSVYPLAKNK